MTQPKPKIKFTVSDYMTTPDDKRYQLLDGEMILAPAPTTRHQRILFRLARLIEEFVSSNTSGEVFLAPTDVVLSEHDVTQPDILFVSNSRAGIVTEANIQGAPDLVVEILSPGTAGYDRGYKLTLYGRYGVLEYWLVDPETDTVEVLTGTDAGLTTSTSHRADSTLTSPLFEDLAIDLEPIFRR